MKNYIRMSFSSFLASLALKETNVVVFAKTAANAEVAGIAMAVE